jgi:GT2 family glycosyltransferase
MELAVARKFDYVLLLNNDTTVEPDFLGALVDLMESDPRIGAAGPKILIDSDRTKIDSMGGVLDLWTAQHHNWREHFTEIRRNLSFVHGAAFMLRREVIEKIGGLDEDFYAYWEESDYCLRLRRAGWTIAVTPRSVVYHKGGQTNLKLSNPYVYYMIRNGFLCLKKNGRWYQWPSFTACFLATSVAKYTAYLLVKRPGDVRVVFEALSDFARGRLGRKEFART